MASSAPAPHDDPMRRVAVNVVLGDGCDLQSSCVIAKAPRGAAKGELRRRFSAGHRPAFPYREA